MFIGVRARRRGGRLRARGGGAAAGSTAASPPARSRLSPPHLPSSVQDPRRIRHRAARIRVGNTPTTAGSTRVGRRAAAGCAEWSD